MTRPKVPNRVSRSRAIGLGVAPRQGQEQQHLQHFVIGQRVRTGGEQPGAHANPVTLSTERRWIVRRDPEQVAIDRIGNPFARRPPGHEASFVSVAKTLASATPNTGAR